jgi:hypothetical protein
MSKLQIRIGKHEREPSASSIRDHHDRDCRPHISTTSFCCSAVASKARGESSPAKLEQLPAQAMDSAPPILATPATEPESDRLLFLPMRGDVMPGDPKECRRHAARCAELAVAARTPQLKAAFLGGFLA